MWPFRKKPDPIPSLISSLEQTKRAVEAEMNKLRASIANQNSALGQAKSELHGRLTKLEVFFADEIKAKELIRDEKVREARAKALGH